MLNQNYQEIKSLLSNPSIKSLNNLIAINHFSTNFAKSYDAPLIHYGYQEVKSHKVMFTIGKFDWIKESIGLDKLLELLESMFSTFPDLESDKINQQKIPFQNFPYYYFGLVKKDFFQSMLDLSLCQNYLTRYNSSYGTNTYDKIIKFQSQVLQFFEIFHLRADARNMIKLRADELDQLTPLYRIQVREANRASGRFNGKYFSRSFEVQEFVLELCDAFIPNVTTRHIGRDNHATERVLGLMSFLFELGLWTKEDIPKILKLLLTKAENLIKLEECCSEDSKSLTAGFNQELLQILTTCRETFAQILLQIIILLNDAWLEEKIEENTKNNGRLSFGREEDQSWTIAYLSDKGIYSKVNQILVSYLLVKTELELGKVGSKKLQIFLTKILSIKSNPKADLFSQTLSLTDKQDLDAFLLRKRTPFQELRRKAAELSISTSEVIERLVCGEYGRQRELATGGLFTTAIRAVVKNISGWLEDEEAGADITRATLSQTVIVNNLLFLVRVASPTSLKSEVVSLLALLAELGEGSIKTQSIIFGKLGKEFIKEIFQKRPLLITLFFKRLFTNDSKLPQSSITVFKFLVSIYEASLKKIEDFKFSVYSFEKSKNRKIVESMLVVFEFNQILQKIIENKQKSSQESSLGRYDTLIQERVWKVVSRSILLFITQKDQLEKICTALGKTQFFAVGKSEKEIIDLNSKTDFSKEELLNLLFEVSVSFLSLLNASTSELYFSNVYESINDFFIKNSLTNYDFLTTKGLLLKLEMTKLFSRFRIYFGNHLIDNRRALNLKEKDKHLEKMFPQDFLTGSLFSDILAETESCRKIAQATSKPQRSLRQSEPANIELLSLDEIAKGYVIEVYFPLVFKLIKGIHNLYIKDDNLALLKESVNSIYKSLQNAQNDIFKLLNLSNPKKRLEQEFLSDIEKSVLQKVVYDDMEQDEKLYPYLYKIRKQCEEILGFLYQNTPKNFQSTYDTFFRTSAVHRGFFTNRKNLSKINELNPFTISKNDKFMRFGTKELKFGSKHDVLPREELLGLVRDPCSSRESLINFSRLQITSKEFDSPSKKYLEKDHDQLNKVLKYSDKNLVELSSLKRGYLKAKSSLLSQKETDLLFIFMRSNSHNAKSFLNFALNQLEQLFIEEFKPETHIKIEQSSEIFTDTNYVLKIFLAEKSVLTFINFLYKAVSDSDFLRNSFYDLITLPYQNSFTNMATNKLSFSLSNLEKIQNSRTKILSIIYSVFCRIGEICNFKTFHDGNWLKLWGIYHKLGYFFKNLCENNNQRFKLLLSRLVPKLRTSPKFNLISRTIVFDLFVRHEHFASDSKVWTNRLSRLTPSDRPENFCCMNLYFRILNEFVNGPCPYNQRLLFRYKVDVWVGLIRRIVDDVNSDFYSLKENAIDYLTSLMEGEGYTALDQETKRVSGSEDKFLITRFFLVYLPPKELLHVMTRLLKKLYCYFYLKKYPKRKEILIQKVVRERVEIKLQEETKEKMKKLAGTRSLMLEGARINKNIKQRRETLIKNEMSLMQSYSEHESGLGLVPKELESEISIPSYKTLLEIYLRNPEFSNHRILDICLKLYSLLVHFTKLGGTGSASLLKEEKDLAILLLFRSQVSVYDKDPKLVKKLKARHRGGELDKLAQKEHPADIICYMFLKNISIELEISVGGAKRRSKLAICKKEPDCFFLEKETMAEFEAEVDLKNKLGSFQASFPEFFIEMELNRKFYARAPFLFFLSSNGFLRVQMKICWSLGLLINFMILVDYRMDRGLDMNPHRMNFWIEALSLLLAGYSLSNFFLWLVLRYKSERAVQLERFRKRFPLENPHRLRNLLYVNLYKSFLALNHVSNFLCHFLFVILGILIAPVFHTLHLLLIVNISLTARYVINSTTQHLNQILITLLLSIFLVWTYSVLTAQYFHDKWDELDSEGMNLCHTLHGCFFYVLNLGLRNGGGIADSMEVYELENEMFFPKLIFDLSFFIFINVISLNIIFGIIIDQFGEMRHALRERSNLNISIRRRFAREVYDLWISYRRF